jgi:hypothetical protein
LAGACPHFFRHVRRPFCHRAPNVTKCEVLVFQGLIEHYVKMSTCHTVRAAAILASPGTVRHGDDANASSPDSPRPPDADADSLVLRSNIAFVATRTTWLTVTRSWSIFGSAIGSVFPPNSRTMPSSTVASPDHSPRRPDIALPPFQPTVATGSAVRRFTHQPPGDRSARRRPPRPGLPGAAGTW